MSNVIEFTGTQVRLTKSPRDDGFLSGYAAAIADVRRNGGFIDAEVALNGSGLELCDFEAANVEEYDLEELVEIYKEM